MLDVHMLHRFDCVESSSPAMVKVGRNFKVFEAKTIFFVALNIGSPAITNVLVVLVLVFKAVHFICSRIVLF